MATIPRRRPHRRWDRPTAFHQDIPLLTIGEEDYFDLEPKNVQPPKKKFVNLKGVDEKGPAKENGGEVDAQDSCTTADLIQMAVLSRPAHQPAQLRAAMFFNRGHHRFRLGPSDLTRGKVTSTIFHGFPIPRDIPDFWTLKEKEEEKSSSASSATTTTTTTTRLTPCLKDLDWTPADAQPHRNVRDVVFLKRRKSATESSSEDVRESPSPPSSSSSTATVNGLDTPSSTLGNSSAEEKTPVSKTCSSSERADSELDSSTEVSKAGCSSEKAGSELDSRTDVSKAWGSPEKADSDHDSKAGPSKTGGSPEKADSDHDSKTGLSKTGGSPEKADSDHDSKTGLSKTGGSPEKADSELDSSSTEETNQTLRGTKRGKNADPTRYRMAYWPRVACTLMVNAHLAPCLMRELACCREFRVRFSGNLRRRWQKGWRCGTAGDDGDDDGGEVFDAELFDEVTVVGCLVDLVFVYPLQRMDRAWNRRVLVLVKKRMLLERSFLPVSTAWPYFSALPEYFAFSLDKVSAAENPEAGKAMRMSDIRHVTSGPQGQITSTAWKLFRALGGYLQGHVHIMTVLLYSMLLEQKGWDISPVLLTLHRVYWPRTATNQNGDPLPQ